MLGLIWLSSKQQTWKQKNRLKGKIGYADISSAVNRWITTNSMRSEIANNVLEIVDLDKPIDGTKELRDSRIAKDKEGVQKVKNW